MREERDKLRKKTIQKKKLALNNLRNSQSIHIRNDTKIRRVTVRKACSEVLRYSWITFSWRDWLGGDSFIHSTISRKPGIVLGLSRKDLWRILLFNGVNTDNIHRRPTRFLRMLYQEKYCQLVLNQTKIKHYERGYGTQSSTSRKLGDKTAQLQTCATLQGKGRMTLKLEPRVQRTTELSHRGLFPGLETL